MPKNNVLLTLYKPELNFLKKQIHSIPYSDNTTFTIGLDSKVDLQSLNIQHVLTELSPEPSISNSPISNFSRCLNAALTKTDSQYFFFCDQDDIWEEDKIKKSLVLLEQAKGPAAVYSNLSLIDENDKLIHASFRRQQNLASPPLQSFAHALTQNGVTGCTLAINRELAELVNPIPHDCIMHDWFIAQMALLCGKLIYIDEPLVQYRQHGKNIVGARKKNIFNMLKKPIVSVKSLKTALKNTYRQAMVLDRHLSQKQISISKEHRQILDTYKAMKNDGLFKKIYLRQQYGIQKYPLLREILSWPFL